MTETKTEFVSLCSDTTFKYLLKEEDTRKWIFDIIKRKTGINLNYYQIIDNENNVGNHIKDYRMDLVFEKGNTVVIVEMTNSDKEADYIKNYQYLYRTEARRFTSGEKYSRKRTILILFNHFKNHQNKNLLDAHFTLNDPINHLLIEDIESYEIYLPNYEKKCYDKYDEMERRLVLFNSRSFEEMEDITKDSFDLKIIKELRNLSMDEVFLTEYEKEKVQEKLVNSAFQEGINKGMEQGIEQGIEQGVKKEKIEIVKSMLANSIDIKVISACTGLTIEEINRLLV